MNPTRNSGPTDDAKTEASSANEPWYRSESGGMTAGDLAGAADSPDHEFWSIVRTRLGVDVRAGHRASVRILHCPRSLNAIEITTEEGAVVECELVLGEPETERMLSLLTQAICRGGAPALIRIRADVGINVDRLRDVCDDFEIALLIDV